MLERLGCPVRSGSGPTSRPKVVRSIAAAVVGSLVLTTTVACGQPDRSADLAARRDSGSSASSPAAAPSTATGDQTSTSTTEPTCGPLTVDDVAAVLDADPSEVRIDHLPTGAATCTFRSGSWWVSSSVAEVVPDIPTTAPAAPSTVPGLDVPSLLEVRMERGGRFQGTASLIRDGSLYTVVVGNDDDGPDTYPPGDGPLQEPRTREVTIALARAVRAGSDPVR